MKQKLLMAIMCFCLFSWANAQESFNGIGSGMGNLFRLSDAKTRSISPENFTGEKVREEWLIPKMRNEMWPMRVMLLVIWDKDGK